jgi:predicted HicB family RNase H-like nuclease
MPTKNSDILCARVDNGIIELARIRAEKRGLTLNAWLNRAIRNALRSHQKRHNGQGTA